MLSEANSKDLSSVEVMVPGGASVPDSISENYRNKLPNIKVKLMKTDFLYMILLLMIHLRN